MKIQEITLRLLRMKMKFAFTTSFGSIEDKDLILVETKSMDGISGWGESVAFHAPLYNEETVKTNWHIMEEFLIPLLLKNEINHPDDVSKLFSPIRGNNMAKAALEGAVWDLYAKLEQLPLYKALGGDKKEIAVGVSIGIQNSIGQLLDLIERYLSEGYQRIKVKIKPGWDINCLKAIRDKFPTTPLMADANSAYTLQDLDLLKKLDDFDLLMIEQPLAYDDIVDHAKLQKELKTPICLDESIHSFEDARKAIELGSCKVINIKIGRVGGLTESKKIHDLCKGKNIPVWCGGMLEAGIGRAHNVALTTLSNFTLPGDTAASSRYWERDIIEPEVTVNNGFITVSERIGIGYTPNFDYIEKLTTYKKTYK